MFFLNSECTVVAFEYSRHKNQKWSNIRWSGWSFYDTKRINQMTRKLVIETFADCFSVMESKLIRFIISQVTETSVNMEEKTVYCDISRCRWVFKIKQHGSKDTDALYSKPHHSLHATNHFLWIRQMKDTVTTNICGSDNSPHYWLKNWQRRNSLMVFTTLKSLHIWNIRLE